MITATECAEFADLASNEMLLGEPPSARHHSLLSSYRLNLKRGRAAVCEMILSDLRNSIDLGAVRRAADLLVVLRLFLSQHQSSGPSSEMPASISFPYSGPTHVGVPPLLRAQLPT